MQKTQRKTFPNMKKIVLKYPQRNKNDGFKKNHLLISSHSIFHKLMPKKYFVIANFMSLEIWIHFAEGSKRQLIIALQIQEYFLCYLYQSNEFPYKLSFNLKLQSLCIPRCIFCRIHNVLAVQRFVFQCENTGIHRVYAYTADY